MVVHTEGSTYRKSGALAVVSADGTQHGAISGGCLEPVLQARSRQAIEGNSTICIVFDTQSDDDLVFGSGSGCRGQMTVMLIPIQAHDRSALVDALDIADAGHTSLRLAMVVEGPLLSHGWCWYGSEEVALGGGPSELQKLRRELPGEFRVTISARETRVAVLAVHPSPRVLLIGAGPEAHAFIQTARGMGWRTTVIDHREAALRSNASLADHSIAAWPTSGLAKQADQVFDACVVMTHSAANDLEALIALARRDETYIGLLGPPARRDELLNRLDQSTRAALANRLHAPVGLYLGGNGPEALALSIAAELQQQFSGQR